MSEARQRRPGYGEAAALEEAEGLRRTAERDRLALEAARAAGHNPWPTAEDRARAAQNARPAAPFDLRDLGDEPAERAALDARAAAEEDRGIAAADLDRADRAVAGLAADLGAFADLDGQLIEHEQRVIVAGLAADVPPALAARQRERAHLTDRLDRARQVQERLTAAVAAADAPLAVARAAAARAAARVLAARAIVRAEELRAVEQAAAQLRGELSALSTCWLGAQSVPPRPATADRLRPAPQPARERLASGERDAGRPGAVAPRLRCSAGGPGHAAAIGAVTGGDANHRWVSRHRQVGLLLNARVVYQLAFRARSTNRRSLSSSRRATRKARRTVARRLRKPHRVSVMSQSEIGRGRSRRSHPGRTPCNIGDEDGGGCVGNLLRRPAAEWQTG